MDFTNISKISESLTQLSVKQKTIASNIANVDTPHFKSSTTNFEDYTDQLFDKQKKEINTFTISHKNHISLDKIKEDNIDFKIKLRDQYMSQNDGNDVGLDQEKVEMSKVNMLMNAALGAYKKEATLIRSVLDVYSRLN